MRWMTGVVGARGQSEHAAPAQAVASALPSQTPVANSSACRTNSTLYQMTFFHSSIVRCVTMSKATRDCPSNRLRCLCPRVRLLAQFLGHGRGSLAPSSVLCLPLSVFCLLSFLSQHSLHSLASSRRVCAMLQWMRDKTISDDILPCE